MFKSTLLILTTLLALQTIAEPSPDASQLGQQGAFRVSFKAGQLFSESQALEYGEHLSMDETITWEVYVPNNYDPATPAGILTYVSPTRSGRIWEDWKAVVDEQNLIWIGANESGNTAPLMNRYIFAVLGTELASQFYAVDEKRTYISGFSGGGRVASMLMHRYSHLYTGAIYVCGVNIWEDLPKKMWATLRARKQVFLTGTKDFNYRDTLDVYKLYKQAGIRKTKLMTIQGMGHRLPDPNHFNEALKFLDTDSSAPSAQ